MQRLNGVCIYAIQHAATLPSRSYQPYALEHPEVLRHRRLRQVQLVGDFPYGALLQSQTIQDFAPTWFGDRVEGIRSGGRSGHKAMYIPVWEYVKRKNSTLLPGGFDP